MSALIINFQAEKDLREKQDVTRVFLGSLGLSTSDESVNQMIRDVEAKEAELQATMEFEKPNNIIGSKFEQTKDLDIKDIAKMVRADIKAAKKDGRLPKDLKASVKISRYSMGQSLNVEVKEFTGQIYNPEWIKQEDASCGELPTAERHNAEAKGVLKVLQNIVSSYNYDKSHTQSDYFNKRFYGSVEFNSELRQKDLQSQRNAL